MRENKWVRLLAYVTGLVNQRLLLQNEYLVAENRILRSHLPARLLLTDPERSTLAEIGKGCATWKLRLGSPARLPVGLKATIEMAAAKCEEGVSTTHGPEHAGPFEA